MEVFMLSPSPLLTTLRTEEHLTSTRAHASLRRYLKPATRKALMPRAMCDGPGIDVVVFLGHTASFHIQLQLPDVVKDTSEEGF